MAGQSELFRGPAVESIPIELYRRTAMYRSVDERGAPPVTHLCGYEEFAAFLGDDVVALSSDMRRLFELIASRRGALAADPVLLASAAVFLGNSIINARPSCRWRGVEASGSEVGEGRRWYDPRRVIDFLVEEDTVTIEQFTVRLLPWLDAAGGA